jgi:hypothetical protein
MIGDQEKQEQLIAEIRGNRTDKDRDDELKIWLDAVNLTALITKLEISSDDVQLALSDLVDALVVTAGISENSYDLLLFQYEYTANRRQFVAEITQLKVDVLNTPKSKEAFKEQVLGIVMKYSIQLSKSRSSKPVHLFELFSWMDGALNDAVWLMELKEKSLEPVDETFLLEISSPLIWANYLTEWGLLSINKEEE